MSPKQPTTEDVRAAERILFEPSIIAYCVPCREKVTMMQPERITLKSGKPAIKGHCSVCGAQVLRLGATTRYVA